MKLPTNFHWLRLITVVVLFILIGILVLNKDQAKDVIRAIFESGAVPVFVWMYVFVAVLSKKMFVEKGTEQFKGYADFIFTVATFGFAGSTSIALLQGVYLQYFYGAEYFAHFGALDLASIALVSSYLLVFTGTETTKMLADVVVRANAVEVRSSDAA